MSAENTHTYNSSVLLYLGYRHARKCVTSRITPDSKDQYAQQQQDFDHFFDSAAVAAAATVSVTDSESDSKTMTSNTIISIRTAMTCTYYIYQDGRVRIEGKPVVPITMALSASRLVCCDIACGIEHCWMLCNDGRCYAIGNNSYGQLGVDQQQALKPILVEFPSSVDKGHDQTPSAISLNGMQDLVLDEHLIQTQILSGKCNSVVKSICVSNEFSLALMSDGTIYQCGAIPGVIGDRREMHQINIVVECSFVACCRLHAVAIDHQGQAWSWGIGLYGALGHGSTENVVTPQLIEELQGIKLVQAACGIWHTLLLDEFGAVYGTGSNQHKQLFGITQHDTPANTFTPQLLETIPGCDDENQTDLEICTIACGSRHSAALSSTGMLYTWGWNGKGQIESGPDHASKLVNDYSQTCHDVARTGTSTPLLFQNTYLVCGRWHTIVAMQKQND
jgi:alpha-tubulin suppressor-like RCC1 family protein